MNTTDVLLNAFQWGVSWAGMVTLGLCIFVLLYHYANESQPTEGDLSTVIWTGLLSGVLVTVALILTGGQG